MYRPFTAHKAPTSFRTSTDEPVNRALQAAQHELERQKITDSLKKGLESRPDKDSLVESM